MKTIGTICLAALSATLALPSPAFSQAPNADPKACSDAATGPDQNLSDRLAQSNGVICPPNNVDPDMKTPAPNAGKMPVIPPPGSPGGDPNVQPK